MPIGNYAFVIYSNDGSTEYIRRANDPIPQLEVGDNSVISGGFAVYTYAGTKTFKGLATTPNATDAVYVPGDIIELTEYGLDVFYVVDADPIPTEKVSVLYKGELIGTIEQNNEGIIGCTGETMEDDIIIRVPVMGGVNLINFTIGGASYQAEEGMNWGEWVYSSYASPNGYVTAGHVYIADNVQVISVSPRTVITPNGNYSITHSEGSGN